jgi:phosphoglycerate dehydrogenase-like enzyme
MGTPPPAQAEQLRQHLDSDANVVLAWDLDFAAVPRLLAEAPSLRWFHMRWAGVPPRLAEMLAERDVILTSGSGAFGAAVAEYVVAAILGFYKRVGEMRERQARHEWWDAARLEELGGRTVGIIGLGDLGRSTARRLRAFDVRLLGLSRGGQPTAEVDGVYTPTSIAEFLRQLDVLVIAAPLTDETRGLIGSDNLAAMPKGALLVNVGRGPIVNEHALIEGLRSGQLGGAALEVFDSEPLDKDSPLWDMPNVSINPHVADNTDGSDRRATALFLDNLARFTRGERLRNVIDPAVGY